MELRGYRRSQCYPILVNCGTSFLVCYSRICESHTGLVLLATWLVKTSSLPPSPSETDTLACFFPSLLGSPFALIAEKNATFWTPVKSTRTLTLKLSDIFYESKEQRKRTISRFLPKIASPQSSRVLHTKFHAVWNPSSITLQTHFALTILHFPATTGLM